MITNGTANENQIEHCIYAASLAKSETTPRVMFWRLSWEVSQADIPSSPALDDPTLYFRVDTDGQCRGIAKEEALRHDNRAHNVSRAIWEDVSPVPDSLVEHLSDQFLTGQISDWNCAAFGILDEEVFNEHLVNEGHGDSVIGKHFIHLAPDVLNGRRNDGLKPFLLVLKAQVIVLATRTLWNVSKVSGRGYSSEKIDNLSTTTLARIGTTFENTPVLLIDRARILEHCVAHSKCLTKEIVNAMWQAELALICDRARDRIAENLHSFTYGGSFQMRRFNDVCDVKWLVPLLGGDGVQQRNEFYKLANARSAEEYVQSRCCVLDAATAVDPESGGASNESSIRGLVEDAKQESPRQAQEQFLFLFDFLGRDYLVGLPPEDLPSGTNGDKVMLEMTRLTPVLVQTNLGHNSHLGWLFKRVATIRANTYACSAGSTSLKVADYLADVTASDLLNRENKLLERILEARTPFHERRLLQMIGIPCRQALSDICHERVAAGQHPLRFLDEKAPRTYQSSDEALCEAIREHVKTEELLNAVEDLDALQNLLQQPEFENQPTVLGKMAVLSKIASFDENISNTFLGKRLDTYKRQLNEQGHVLAAQLCKTVLGRAGRPIEPAEILTECKEWIGAFWKIIGQCFPDAGPAWKRIRESSYPRASRDLDTENNVYTHFIIASVFDRQITSFYESVGRYAMPYGALLWGLNSVYRLQMLSAVMQMCCGDWVCGHSADNVFSRRLVWSYRLAASAKPWRAAEDRAGRMPQPYTAMRQFCHNSSCRHISPHAALNDVGQMLHFDETTLCKVLQKMGWWFNSVLDESLHAHFRCKCGTMMAPILVNNQYTMFRCPRSGADEHDANVYLNWCYGAHCNNAIDSRVETKQCSKGFRICSKCGTCCDSHSGRVDYDAEAIGREVWVPACHSCSRQLVEAWNKMRSGAINADGESFKCGACQETNWVYPSREAWWGRKRQEMTRSVPSAIQWGMMDQSFRYNTRPVTEG